MTGFSGGSTDTWRDLSVSDSTPVLEAGGEDAASGSLTKMGETVLAKAGTCSVTARQFETGSLPATIRPYDFYLRVLSESPRPEMDPAHGVTPRASRSSGWRGRVIKPVTAKSDIFAITVNGQMIGVIVFVDLERGVPEWKMNAGSGVFTGSFILTL